MIRSVAVLRVLLLAGCMGFEAWAQMQVPASPSQAQTPPGQESKPEAESRELPAAAYPNIILITMDTTRADRMGFLGSKRGLTPHLDAVARDSVIFTHAYSQAPLTDTSHATILTGTYPQYHQVLTFPLPLAKTLPFLPDILKAQGYHTGAFVGSLALDATWGAPGFDRGFDTYDAGYGWKDFTPKTRYQTCERRGGEVVKHALAWLAKRPPGPFFMWVHVFDPHDPYDPPEPYKTRYAKALYDGEIAYMDSALGKLLAELKSQGLYDGALITITADHGESLKAHGEDRHGILIYDETIHVPLAIKLPHRQSAGKRVETPVELADITPTLLETLGIAIPKEVQGASMVELMKPGKESEAAEAAWASRGAYSEGDYGHVAFAWSALQSWRTSKYLYIQAPRRELYDYSADAKAAHNLATASPAVADTFAARLKDFQQKTTNTEKMPRNVMDEQKVRKLAALGYIVDIENPALANSPDKGADPKDKIGIANMLLRINDLLELHDCEDAIREARKAIAKDPNISMAYFFPAQCYLEREDWERAVPLLRQAVKLDPAFTGAEMNLGLALLKNGDYDGAITAFEHVVTSEPTLLSPHFYLSIAYAKADRVPEEIKECRYILKYQPDSYGANLQLGHFLAKSGDLEGAIAPLQKAASIRPDAPEPHMYLADFYTEMGREAEAEHERAEAMRRGATPVGPMRIAPEKTPANPETK